MTQEIPFSFSAPEIVQSNADKFVAHLGRDVSSQDQLFNRLYEALQLPGYFGFNWNALYECLTDFHWVKNRSIVLCHDELPRLSQDSLKIYLNILRDAIEDWRGDDEHSFDVVFPDNDKKRITDILA